MTQSTSPPKLSRREREILQNRNAILDAAEEVFGEKGFHAASMESVARRAEFAVGSLYNFFKNKQDLYVAMLNRKVEEFEPIMREAMESGKTPLDRIRNTFFTRYRLFWENPRFYRIYFGEWMGTQFNPSAGLTPEIAERYNLFLRQLENECREAIALGQLADKPPRLMVQILQGAVHQDILRILGEGVQERDEESERALFDMILNGFSPAP